MKKSLAIYVQYDPKGNVGDYVKYCLRGLQEIVDEILVVVNGSITPEGRNAIEDMGIKILARENSGFDAHAWRAGIEYYGYDNIAKYDNLLLLNNSFYGPVFPFSEMWQEMSNRDCDFWGINRHCKLDINIISGDPESKLQEHIQSYWLVFKNRVLKSEEFKQYWQNLKEYKSYKEAVAYGECRMSGYFENCGFKSDTYMDFNKYTSILDNSPMFITLDQVTKDRCPIIKRKYMYDEECDGIERLFSNNDGAKKLLNFLQHNSLYDPNLIWNDLLENHSLGELDKKLHLNFILPANTTFPCSKKHSKAAVIFYIYSADLIDYCHEYAKKVPEYIDIIVINAIDDVQKQCREKFEDIKNNKTYLMQENRGRDQAALLITARDILPKYEYVCFVHSKKTAYFSCSLPGDFFREHCFDSLLFSHEYIENIVTTFQKNPKLGVLVPFIPNTSVLRGSLQDSWIINFDNTMDLLHNRLKVDVVTDDKLMFPAGGMFWFRVDALKPLLSYPWRVTDFPAEPFPAADGLLPHAIERSICLVAQTQKYYSAWTISDFDCNTYLGNFFDESRTPYLLCESTHSGPCQKDFRRYWLNKAKWHKYRFMSHITCGKLHRRYRKKMERIYNRSLRTLDKFFHDDN